MNKLEKKLLDILSDIAKKTTHFSLASDLYEKAKKEIDKAEEKELISQVKEKMAEIFLLFVGKNRDYCEKLLEGNINPSSENLDKLEANLKEILETIDKVSEKCPHVISSEYAQNAKQGIQKTQKELIPVCRQFANIDDQFDKLDKTNFSWQKVKQLWEQSQAIQAPNSLTTETVKMIKAGMTAKIAKMCCETKKAIETGELPVKFLPNKQDLDFIEKIASETLNIMDWIEREKPDFITNREQGDKIKKEVQELKSWIQEQRKKSSLSESQKEKISAQQAEIEQLKNQLAELQKQIDELKKQNSESSQTADNSANQKLTQLENQKKEIEKKIEVQQEKVKERIQQPGNKFQWWWVAVPIGILVLVVGAVVFYLKSKKEK